MKKIFLFVILALAVQGIFAQRQSFEGYIKAGDAAVAQDDYYSAYQFYRIASEFSGHDSDPMVLFKIGESAVKTRAYEIGQKALLKLDSTEEASTYPLRHFYLGEIYYTQGQYDEAVASFEQFLEEDTKPNADQVETANKRIEAANWAIDHGDPDAESDLEHLSGNVNTGYSEVAYTVSPAGAQYYTSNRYPFKQDTLNPRRKLSKVVLRDGTPAGTPLAEQINTPGKLVAHSAFHPDGNRVYFSQCSYIDFDAVRCGLFMAEVNAAGEWQTPVELTELNDTTYTVQMPNVGRDEAGKDYLYFSSNRPGGAGGLDLYRSPLMADGMPGEPENLNQLNTAGNDVTPFYYAPLQMLYFATDGRETFGGLDVYKSYVVGSDFRSPVNLGDRLNSSYDDAYYTRFENVDKAFISSTRRSPDAVYFSEEKEVCCYDIYQFTPDDRIDLLVTTFNGLTDLELAGVTVILYEITPTGPVPIEKVTNPEGNDFAFKIEPGKVYELRGEKEGFSVGLDRFDLNDPTLAGVPVVERRLDLLPTIMLDVFTFNNNDKKELEGATVSLYRVGPGGEEELVAELTNELDNDFEFPLEIGYLYRLRGNRPGFGEAIDEVDTRNFTGDASQRLRRDLYLGQLLEILVVDGVTGEPLSNATVDLSVVNGEQIGRKTNPIGNDFLFTVNLNEPFAVYTTRDEYRPSRDTLEFTLADLDRTGGKLQFTVPLFSADINRLLPTEVFFDNDHPNPKTYTRTTTLTYEDTYYPYAEKRDTFIKTFTEVMDQEEEFVTRLRYRDFFNLQVDGGWKQLQALAAALEGYLEDGNEITLLLQGFASPRAPSNYNLRLSQRRIASVINYLQTQNDGALLPYIRSGKLEFNRDPRGETADPEKVSDRLDDPRQSVFSLVASLERRVKIWNADKVDQTEQN